MNQWTRYLTIVILLLQGPAYITNLHAQLPSDAFLVQGFGFNIFATIVLMAGTMFVMWLGERITDRGIGNGISLIIMVGIIARLRGIRRSRAEIQPDQWRSTHVPH